MTNPVSVRVYLYVSIISAQNLLVLRADLFMQYHLDVFKVDLQVKKWDMFSKINNILIQMFLLITNTY